MNSSVELATEFQVRRLRQFGYKPAGQLTRTEAAQLLHEYEVHPETRPSAISEPLEHRKAVENLALALRTAVGREEASAFREKLDAARKRRWEFWLETCRDPTQMHSATPQVLELYRKHGCRFTLPSHEQIQEVLDALDAAFPSWDADHPELFYQTLELNFRELIRHS